MFFNLECYDVPYPRLTYLFVVVGGQGVEHIPRRCRSKGCIFTDKTRWNNFVAVRRGDFQWVGRSGDLPSVIMLNPTFGVTLKWYRTFSNRLLTHQVSFKGEADLMDRSGHAISHALSVAVLLIDLFDGYVSHRVFSRVADAVSEVWFSAKQEVAVSRLVCVCVGYLLKHLLLLFLPTAKSHQLYQQQKQRCQAKAG